MMKAEQQRTALDDVREMLLHRATRKASAVCVLLEILEKVAREREAIESRTKVGTK